MTGIIIQDISRYFSSFFRLGTFALLLVLLNVLNWVLPSTSILEYGYADLRPMFDTIPVIFIFLIPSSTMHLMVEDFENGTTDLIFSRTISCTEIWWGHFVFGILIVLLFLIFTMPSVVAVNSLKSPLGIIDFGQITASYIGLLLLGFVFLAISLFYSTIANNQAAAFLLSCTSCYILFYIPSLLANVPQLFSGMDTILSDISLDTHFNSLGKGLVSLKTLIYFASLVVLFSVLSIHSLRVKLK